MYKNIWIKKCNPSRKLTYKYCCDCGRENNPPYTYRNCKSCMEKVKKGTLFNCCQRCNGFKKNDIWGLCPKCQNEVAQLNEQARKKERKM